MPYVTVKMLEGRTDDQKRALVEKVTDAVVETTGASKEESPSLLKKCPKITMPQLVKYSAINNQKPAKVTPTIEVGLFF